VDRSPTADEWSAHVVVHPADAEQVYGVRLRMLLTRERPFLAAYAVDPWLALCHGRGHGSDSRP